MLVALAISAAGIFDVLENSRILNGLHHLNSLTSDWNTPRALSLLKWVSFAIALSALAILVAAASRALSVVLLASAFFTMVGLLVAYFMKLASLCFGLSMVIALIRYFPFRELTVKPR